MSSALGRRGREGSQPRSGRDKVRIREFAADRCAEFELSASDAKDIMRDSQVSQSLSNIDRFIDTLKYSCRHRNSLLSYCAK